MRTYWFKIFLPCVLLVMLGALYLPLLVWALWLFLLYALFSFWEKKIIYNNSFWPVPVIFILLLTAGWFFYQMPHGFFDWVNGSTAGKSVQFYFDAAGVQRVRDSTLHFVNQLYSDFSLSCEEWTGISFILLIIILTRRRCTAFIMHRLPNEHFETAMLMAVVIPQELLERIRLLALQSLCLSPFWFLALKLLKIEYAPQLTVLFMIFLLLPYFGLWIGFLCAFLFIQKNMAYYQLVGLFVSAASVWLLRHVFFSSMITNVVGPVKISIIFVCCLLGYIIHQITGMFILPMLAVLGFFIAVKIPSQNR